MKTYKNIYFISTGLLSLLLLFSAGMYFFNHEEVAKMFTRFGYSTDIIYPYAVAKIVGVIALWYTGNNTVKLFAYLGFFIAFTLAIIAHLTIKDGEQTAAIVAMVLLIASYFSDKKIRYEEG
ncbi:DoxX-like family protein [Polaribacter sp. KT25b]|uniref:DoxX family protein n=1 Tax=Polaribacter sp. KT25b TaxID=1855336 RepID=UPI00087D77C1|nr:DoxX family protein [Polaribacter sp. KT25b]SDR79378.1 DoxX-like family protein [Polaribacter sp. KT25b]